MASFRFALKNPKALEKTPIRLQIRYNSKRINVYFGERALPAHWTQKTQKVKTVKTAPEINGRLSNIKTAAENVFRKYQNEHNQEEPPPSILKRLIEVEIGQGKAEGKMDLLSYYTEFIEGKKVDYQLEYRIKDPAAIKKLKYRNSAIPGYMRSRELLIEFSRTYRVDFDTINGMFKTKYIKFLREKHDFEQNTIARHFTLLKAVLNSATREGLNKSLIYQGFKIKTQESFFMYLNKTELEVLTGLEMEKEYYERIRDLFLVGCWTGLRYSDFSRLSPDMINYDEEKIRIKTLKTGNPVVIPFLPELKILLLKYKKEGLPSYRNQVMNRELKKIGELLAAKIEELNIPSLEKKDYSRICTHTARRSFCTNMFLEGVAPSKIRPISGHKTEKEFLKYIRVSSEKAADVFLEAATENKPVVQLKAV